MLKKLLSIFKPTQIPPEEAFAKLLILMSEDEVVKLSVERIVMLPIEKRRALLGELKQQLGKSEFSVIAHLESQDFCNKVKLTKINQ